MRVNCALFGLLLIYSFAVQKAFAIAPHELSVGKSKFREFVLGDAPKARLRWTMKRPKLKDTSILLSVPAAFTSKTDTVVGAYAFNGKWQSGEQKDNTVGGAVSIVNDKCRIFSLPKGAIAKDLVGSVSHEHDAFFQAFTLVLNGKPEHFKDKALFQRRALALWKDNKVSIIESDSELTLTEFASELAALGATDAANLDMGAWDEGWYRDDHGKVVAIGKDKSQTFRQTNWLTFRTHLP